ncbi:acyl carrier protein [Kitasatospora sp. NPDC059722]|uniref:acyl carrier protein n=1 Tax=Kitasatospora sp. NPDC059722 TaxID=3346925 RepID=UPI0036BCDF29
MTRDRLVEWLADYIAELLDIAVEEVGTELPLTALGVDSATTLVLAADLGTKLRRQVRPKEILEHPTIEGLAEYLASAGTEADALDAGAVDAGTVDAVAAGTAEVR